MMPCTVPRMPVRNDAMSVSTVIPANVRVLTVVGNRPQFIKAAAVSHRLREVAEEVLVHTGQHYDDELSQVFFDELGLPAPEHHLDLGGGSNTAQTARMLDGARAAAGRASSPTSCSSTATPTRRWRARWRPRRRGMPVAHVEAGMRSFDRAMPEELNRVLTDHASALLLCSSEAAAAQPARASASRGGSRSSAT